jgi:hypothetical protein
MRNPAPNAYWFITLLAVLWASFGAVDYVLTQYKNVWYFSHFPQDQIAYYANMPLVSQVAWGVAVWSVVLGAILLILRDDKAVLSFAVGFIAYFIAVVWLAYVTDPSFYTVSGPIGAVILWGSVAINLGLWIVSRGYRKSGVID